MSFQKPCKVWPLKNHVRYCKMGKWPPKSAVRYANTQNQLSPLWAPSDFGHLKSQQTQRNLQLLFYDCHHSRLIWILGLKNAIRMPLYFWHCTHYGLPAIFFAKIVFLLRMWGRERGQPNGYMESGSEPGYTRPSHEDGTFTQGRLPQIIYNI